VQQGGEGEEFLDPGPQLTRELGGWVGRGWNVWIDDFRPGNGQFGARAVGQFDQVAGFAESFVPGPPQHLNNMVVKGMVGMRHPDHSVIL
jgi:hypothetical protein